MFDLNQFDEAIYGPAGGPREYAERMGRENGGGWINGPLAYSDFDGKGIVAQPPERDGERNNFGPSVGAGTLPGNTIWMDVMSAGGSSDRFF